MSQAASQGQTRFSTRRPAIIAGVGIAFIAAAVTAVFMMSGSSSQITVADGASLTDTNQCHMIQRELLVSATGSGGTVRLREGVYLSPPIKLGPRPQAVVFPLPRPQTMPVQEVLTIEGNSSDVVITSPVTPLRQVFPAVAGVTAFPVTWKPMKSC